jgi:hypothetical protein
VIRPPGIDRWTARACIALFLLVAGGRLWAVGYAGSHLPLWDQWWMEFGTLLAPQVEGTLGWNNIAILHNEHRLLYPKLLTLGLLSVAGRWEPMDELVVSAFVRAGGLVIVFLLVGRGQSLGTRRALLALLGAVGALPVGPFNLLSGFQVQFSIGETLAVAALAALLGSALTVDSLAIGFGLLLLAVFNMATPVITAVGAAITLGLRGVRMKDRSSLLAAGCLMLFAGFCFWSAPSNRDLAAQGLGEFVTMFLRLGGWPFPETPFLVVSTLAPFLLLLRRLMMGDAPSPHSWFLLGLGAASIVQQAAIAFARARSIPASFGQYTDGLWFGHIVGFVVLVEALRSQDGASRSQIKRLEMGWAAALLLVLAMDVGLRQAPALASIRAAVASREPLFATALQTGRFEAFQAEGIEINRLLVARDLGFFDKPAGRFAVPAFLLSKLEKGREAFLPRMPAVLVAAEPSLISRALRFFTTLAPLVALAGLAMIGVVFRTD